MGRQRVSEQAPFRIRVGPGKGPDGLLGDDELLVHGTDQYIADWFRGLQGQPLPRWIGGLHLYWGDELLTSITVLREDSPKERPSSETPGHLDVVRAEVGHLEARRTMLARQLELDERALQRVQSDLVAQEARLETERQRYERETTRMDDSLERQRKACEEAKGFFARDLQVFRAQAEGVRDFLHASTSQTRDLLASIREGEALEAEKIAQRKATAVTTMTELLNHVADLELGGLDALMNPGAGVPQEQGETFWDGAIKAGFKAEDVLGLAKHLGEKFINARWPEGKP